MKHGLMYYPSRYGNNKNIGDYIQSVAADQFMHATELVDREHLHEYHGEKVKVILNGWFMHYPENFPPSQDIVPLFISFHLRPCMAETLLTPATIAYMKAHGPVGCRDRTTMSILEAHGVPAYFSSCLTLTLGRSFAHAPAERQHGVCFVDPWHCLNKWDALRGLPWMLLHPVMTFRIFAKMQRQALKDKKLKFHVQVFLKLGAFLRAYLKLFTKRLLLDAEYYSHNVRERLFADEKSKLAYCRSLLQRYAEAKFCVTCRIHCALPCVAMGTPVVFVESKDKDVGEGRFDGIRELFNMAEVRHGSMTAHFKFTTDEPDGRIGVNAKLNATDRHLEVVADMSRRCEAFARESS